MAKNKLSVLVPNISPYGVDAGQPVGGLHHVNVPRSSASMSLPSYSYARSIATLCQKQISRNMSKAVSNPHKVALRKQIKEALSNISAESRTRQSKAITEKVLNSEAYQQATNVSVYLSTDDEVCTLDLLRDMFRQQKHVFVPTYSGSNMEMVRLKDFADYEALPLTKWHIKQPSAKEGRENALTNGEGIDLFLMPGVAFTRSGGRCGHGMGYYDKFLKRHFETYPNKKVTLMALAFLEQIVDEGSLPLDEHDVPLNCVITE